jgi:hypothetical protein
MLFSILKLVVVIMGRSSNGQNIIPYFILASCCTVLFNGFCRLCYRLRADGNRTEQTNNKEKASRQIHMQETIKLTKKNSTGKTQMKTRRM